MSDWLRVSGTSFFNIRTGMVAELAYRGEGKVGIYLYSPGTMTVDPEYAAEFAKKTDDTMYQVYLEMTKH